MGMVDSFAIFSLFIAFLLGSIPFGVVLARLFRLPDPREIGSGNIGATNILRTGRKDVAAITMLLDGLKGYFAVFVTGLTAPSLMPFAMLLAVLGHVYTPWLGFKGGKGVATSFGVIFAISPMAGFLTAFIWIITFYSLRISSLAALVAMISSPIFMWADQGMLYATVSVILTALIFHTHKHNITRLMNGTEPKFTLKKDPEPPAPSETETPHSGEADTAEKTSNNNKNTE